MRDHLVRRWAAVAVATLAIAGCANGSGGFRPNRGRTGEVRVAAAADLKGALDDVIADFSAAGGSNGPRVVVLYGSSGNLSTQILNGADFDVFLAADADYVKRLLESGVAAQDDAFIYARGRLAVVGRSGLAAVASEGITALASPEIQKIAIANPQHAPYGRAAREALEAYGIHERVAGKLAVAENVGQAIQFVDSGAADAGIVAVSLVIAAGRKLPSWHVPESAHAPLIQSGVLLGGKGDAAGASAFAQFLRGPRGMEILERYGFEIADLPDRFVVG